MKATISSTVKEFTDFRISTVNEQLAVIKKKLKIK